MPDLDPEKPVEDLLDSLLSQYSSAEPRPGLETRILANLRQAQEPKPRLWMKPWLLGAGAALVSLALWLLLLLQVRPSRQHAPIEAHKPEQRPKENDVSGTLLVKPRRVITRIERSGAIPKMDEEETQGLPPSRRPAIFPTPMPLSEQEGFMFLYLANTPKEELIAQGRRDEEKKEEKKDDGFWDDVSPSSSAPQQPGHIR
jgi:hypothetical protein